MADFIISLGDINKKLLIPLIYIIIYIIINFYSCSNESNEVTLFLQGLGFSIGQILSYPVGNIINYRSINEKKNKNTLIQYIKNYFILFLIDCFYMINNLIPFYFVGENTNEGEKMDEENHSVEDLFINDALEIIFLTLSTYLGLKYKYYIHHVISIIIFVILCITIDLILENFKYIDTITLINSITIVLVNSIIYSYFKYLIAVKYYFFMDVLFALGIFNIIVHILSISIILIVQHINGTNKLLFQFFNYYNENGIGVIVLQFMIGLVLIGFCVGFLEFLIMNELTPNYIIIAFCLAKIPTTIYSIEGTNRWIILIVSIFQIISLLFYLEIFEFNFCNLNHNTKKNIEERERKQNNEDQDNEIIIGGGYDIKESIENQKKLEEMKEMDEDQEY